GVLADVLRGDVPGGLARRRGRDRRRAPPADRRPRSRRRPPVSRLRDRPRGPRRARVVADRPGALPPRAPRDPPGRSAHARRQAVGYAVERYKLLAFVIAGTIAGLAGSLYTQFVGSITPDAFLWTTSGEALLMVIIGGTGTLFGGGLGAAAFILLQSLVSS